MTFPVSPIAQGPDLQYFQSYCTFLSVDLDILLVLLMKKKEILALHNSGRGRKNNFNLTWQQTTQKCRRFGKGIRETL